MTKLAKRITIASAVLFMFLLAASIILPLINRQRRAAAIEKTGRNLHQIGLGILIYSNDHQGNFPDSLATLVTTEDLSTENLVDTWNGDTPAKGATTQEIRDQIFKGGHQTYVYLGAGLTDKTATTETVVAYELFPDGSSDILPGDGHSDWLNPSHTQQMLKNRSTTCPMTVTIGVESEG